MPRDASDDLTLVSTLKHLFADLSDLIKKEVLLAKAEVTQMISSGLQAGIFMAAAGFLGFIALLLIIEALVFGLASLGMGPAWASLIVAAVIGLIAAGAFFYGRSLMKNAGKPKRTIKQVNQDIAAVREQLT